MDNRYIKTFISILRAGLWEQEQGVDFDVEDYEDILRISDEQCVQGLVLAGLEHAAKARIPQAKKLQLVGTVLQIEQRNKMMNQFVAELVRAMRKESIYTLLIKGQGVAQCYARPFWRSSGDVDFFLSDDNYLKAQKYLHSIAANIEKEESYKKHLGMTIDGWEVELHGSLRCGFLRRVDKVLDEIQRNTFYDGNVRSWNNNGVRVFMLGPENDVLYVFAHLLNHFYKDGVGLRQVCDWVRLIWTFRDILNIKLLEDRLRQMGMMSEWKTFAALAVGTMGMPEEAMPLYDPSTRWKQKASKVLDFILKTGNFGHNRDMTYIQTKPYLVRKSVSLWMHTIDGVSYFAIFPIDSMKVWWAKVWKGMKSMMRGK